MKTLALTTALMLWAQTPKLGPEQNPIVSRAKEREELVQKLKRDIFKVDRAIGETQRIIAKSRNAPYLPDLQFRLAELYVEKSRYVYYLQAETRPEGEKGALVSPETRLLKQKAVQIYDRLLREFPEFKDGDKVTFYLAHEQRELGAFDELLKTLGELIRKYPGSPLRLEAEQILGDSFFEKSDLTQAEKHYQAILDAPPSAVHDLARYKMGWIRINQSKHADAVTYFEAAAASAPVPGVDSQKALNVKREALLDLVYSYTESRPAKGALQYFEKLSESRTTYALALDKLGTRYFIKQQYEFAIPALRKLMEIQPDPELDSERAMKIYDSLKLAKGKVPIEPVDITLLVRAAVGIKQDASLDEGARKKELAELEEMSRDLATQLHVGAQKKDEKAAYLAAAEGYKQYLTLFRPEKQVRTMMRNRADALFAAKRYSEAARQFEELARYEEKNPQGHESAAYGALLAHFSSLQADAVGELDAFQVADARNALKLLGATYVSRYPKSDKVVEVKFNIARAFYDEGNYEKASELFTAFALAYPSNKDAQVAGHLALDALRQKNDFKGLEATGKKLLQAPLPGPFLAEVQKILTQSRAEALDELALQSSSEEGDVVSGLEKVAQENKGADLGEKALYGAFSAAREKRDLVKQREIGERFAAEYPKSSYLSSVLLTLGRNTAEAGQFSEAAGYLELLGQKLGADSAALDGYLGAARLRAALREAPLAQKDLEAALGIAGSKKAEVLASIALLQLENRQLQKARAAAEQALKLDPHLASAAAVLAETQAILSPDEKPDSLVAILTTVAQGPNGQTEETAKALWYLGERVYRAYKALPQTNVEAKVARLQELEGLYTQAASLGAPEWAVAALWRTALAYQHLADVVEATPLPQGLSAAEVQQFRAAVNEQVAPVKQRAENAFRACLARAASLEVYSPAVMGCRARSEDAHSPLPAPPPAGRVANLDALQKKAEQSQDAASLEALGLGYLGARQLGLAQLVFGRVTELEDNRASAHNALGMTLLWLGDSMGARAAYSRALDADPTYEKARANVAALRCRFGDAEGAKRELSVLKDLSSLQGPDVDPEWKACR